MPIETRIVPAGSITDSDQLQRELNVQSALIGATCSSVAIFTAMLTATVEMLFDVPPNGGAVDAVIAAHPSYTPGLISSVAITSGVWAEIWRLPVIPGERLEIDARVKLTLGDSTNFESATISYVNIARRRIGQLDCTVTCSGIPFERGELPQAQLRCLQDGVFTVLQARVLRTGTLTVRGEVIVESEIIT